MRQVLVKGVGLVNFPDTFTDDDISNAIKGGAFPQPAPPEAEEIGPWGAGRRMSQSALESGIAKLMYGAGLEEQGKSWEESAAELQAEVDQGFRPEVGSYTDIEGVSDVPEYVWNLLGQSAPETGAGILGAIGTQAALGAARGAPLGPWGATAGGIAGAGIALLPFFFGRNLQRQAQEQGIPLKETDAVKAGMAALPQATLDAVLDTFIVGKLLPRGVVSRVLQQEGRKGLRKLGGKFIANAIKGGLVEAPTETAQQLIERVQAGNWEGFTPEVQQELAEAAVGGLTLGGLLGGAAGAVGLEGGNIHPSEVVDRGGRGDKLPPQDEQVLRREAALAQSQQVFGTKALEDSGPVSIEEIPGLTREELPTLGEEEQAAVEATAPHTIRQTTEGFEVVNDMGRPLGLFDTEAEATRFLAKGTTDTTQPASQAKTEAAPAPRQPLTPFDSVPVEELPESAQALVQKRRKSTGLDKAAPVTFQELTEALPKAEANRVAAAVRGVTDEEIVATELAYRDAGGTPTFKNIKDTISDVAGFDATPQYARKVLAEMVNRGILSDTTDRVSNGLEPRIGDLKLSTRESGFQGELPEGTQRRFVPKTFMTEVGEGGTYSFELEGRPSGRTFETKDEAIKAATEAGKKLGKPAKPRIFLARPDTAIVEQATDDEGNVVGEKIVATYPGQAPQGATEQPYGTLEEAQAAVGEQRARRDSARPGARQEYARRQQQNLRRLQNYLRQIGIGEDVGLRLHNVLMNDEGAVGEGYYDPADRTINIATDIYNPGLGDHRIAELLSGVIRHETIHALRELGVLTNDEWNALKRYVAKKTYPGGKDLTFLDWARKTYPDLSDEAQHEEAIAEAYRKWAERKGGVSGKPASIFRRITRFFRRVGQYLRLNGVEKKGEAIYEAIEEGKVGERPRTEKTTEGEGPKFSQRSQSDILSLPVMRYFGGLDVENVVSDVFDPKSRSTLVLMTPDEFISMATPGLRLGEAQAKVYAEKMDRGMILDQIPRLSVSKTDNDQAMVMGHEGRHRAHAFREMGVSLIPVEIRHYTLRWGESESRPETLRGQSANSHNVIKMPQSLVFPTAENPRVETAMKDNKVGAPVSVGLAPEQEAITLDDPEAPASARYVYRKRNMRQIMQPLEDAAKKSGAARFYNTSGLGQYGGFTEYSSSFEAVYPEGTGKEAVNKLAAEVFRLAKEQNQNDAFVAVDEGPQAEGDHLRPGITVYFKNIGPGESERSEEETKQIIDKLSIGGIGGYTAFKVTHAASGGYEGIRFIWTPEYNGVPVDRLNEDKENVLLDFERISEIAQKENIGTTRVSMYNAALAGDGEYDQAIKILEGHANRDQADAGGLGREWPWRQPVRESVARRTRKSEAESKARDRRGRDVRPPKKWSIRQLRELEYVARKPNGDSEGAVYSAPDGNRYLVKFYADDDQAHSEILAARLYEALGIAAPEMALVQDGDRMGVASRWIEGLEPVDPENPAHIKAVRDTFIGDAWLANWDGIGRDFDNTVMYQGKAMKIDPGGSLEFRGFEGRKGDRFGPEVGEIETLRSPNRAYHTSSFYSGITNREVGQQANRLRDVSDEDIARMVDKLAPGPSFERDALAEKMIARKNDILAWQASHAPDTVELPKGTPKWSIRYSSITHESPEEFDNWWTGGWRQETNIKRGSSQVHKGSPIFAEFDIEGTLEREQDMSRQWLQDPAEEGEPLLMFHGAHGLHRPYPPGIGPDKGDRQITHARERAYYPDAARFEKMVEEYKMVPFENLGPESTLQRDFYFVTPEPEFAERFAGHEEWPEDRSMRSRLIPVYVSAQNIWDFENPKHRQMLWDEALRLAAEQGTDEDGLNFTKANFDNETKMGSWAFVEQQSLYKTSVYPPKNPRIYEVLRGMGFDGFTVYEHMGAPSKNLAVFDRRQIKSALNPFAKGASQDTRWSRRGAMPTASFAQVREKIVGWDRAPDSWVRHLGAKLMGAAPGEPLGRAFIRNAVNSALPAQYLDYLRAGEIPRDGTSVMKAMEMATQMTGRIQIALEVGPLSWDPVEQVSTYREDIPGLYEIFEPIGEEHSEAWTIYAVAKREQALRAAGRKGFFNLSDQEINTVINDAPAFFEEVHRNFQDFNEAVIQFAVDTGALDETKADDLRNMAYIPFYRVMENNMEEAGEYVGPQVAMQKTLNNPRSALDKKLNGGVDPLANVYENIIRNIQSIYRAGMANQALQTTARAIESLDPAIQPEIGFEVNQSGPQTMVFRENGKLRHFQIEDPALWIAITSLRPEQRNILVRTAAKFAGILRAGVTLSPGFMLANLWRGKISAFVTTETSLDPGLNTMRGLRDALKHGSSTLGIKAATGIGGYTYGMGERDFSAEFRRRLRRREGGGYGFARDWGDRMMGVVRYLENIGEATEMAERTALYDHLIKKGMAPKEAFYQANNLINYGRKGQGGGVLPSLITALVPMVPFLNARVQGIYRIFEDPSGQRGKRFIGLPMHTLLRGTLVTAASTMLYMMNSDDDRWDDEPIERKINYDIFYAGDKTIYLPRAFEVGSLFGSFPVLLYDAIGKGEGKQLARGTASIFLNTLAFNPIPQAALPALEVLTNYNFYTQAPIESLSDQRLLPSERFDERTSALARGIGGTLGGSDLARALGMDISPKQIDHLISGYLGSMATGLLALTDSALGTAGLLPDRPGGVFGDPHSAVGLLAEAADLERFVRTDADRPSRMIREFYRMKQLADEAYASMRELTLRGDTERARAVLEDKRAAMSVRKSLGRIGESISKVNRQIRAVRFDPDMSSAEKTRRLKKLMAMKRSLARRAVEFGKRQGL